MNRRHAVLASLAAAGLAALGRAARAQTPPVNKTLRIIMGFPAGGSGDVLARLIAPHMRDRYAAGAIVENRVGAGGRIGAEFVKNAEPDGSVVLLTAAPILTVYPHIYRKLSYDPRRDFVPVTSVASFVYALAAGPATPPSVRTVADYLQWAKANAVNANYCSPAAGATPHFLGVMLGRAAGVPLTHVAYKGGAPLAQDLIGGQVPVGIDVLPGLLPHVRSGRVRVLATSGPQRSLPDVPTFAEAGYPDLTTQEYFGLFVPARTPDDLVARMVSAVQAALKQPNVVEGLEKMSLEPTGPSQAEFARQFRSDLERWGPIVASSGFSADD